MDFYDPEDINRFFEMDKDERETVITDWLAEVAEPWQGDSAEDKMARSMISAMNNYCQVMFTTDTDEIKTAHKHVIGLWLHGYVQMCRNFQTLAALTKIKKSFES